MCARAGGFLRWVDGPEVLVTVNCILYPESCVDIVHIVSCIVNTALGLVTVSSWIIHEVGATCGVAAVNNLITNCDASGACQAEACATLQTPIDYGDVS